MNKQFNAPAMILVTAIALLGVGCGNNKMTVAESTAAVVDSGGGTGYIPTSPDGSTGSGSGTGNVSYSNEGTFTPVSINEMNNYVGTRPMNNPTDFKLKVQLSDVGSGKYAGTVTLSYTDSGVRYTGTFSAGTGKNASYSGLKDNNTLEAEYNRFFTSGGKTVFSGFFQDQWGGVVLVVDNVISQGDAQGGTIVTGSLYYKNFAQSYATQSPYRKCWFIYDGPYNCRSGSVINKSAVIPNDGYKKLGTFSGISKTAAFQ
ncbi:hypothetical protein [Bdellovibrio sp. HCB209]|uniref:hypothetical protein n=1 Tax=Bdellovibrio sp. HCB209 TaxID=3394354 RepID=UPI0039B4130F